MGAHGRVGEVVEDEETPEDGEGAVGDEDCLPGGEGAGVEEGEAVGEEAADDLLAAVHHVPECDGLGLFGAFVPHAGGGGEL